MVLRNNKSIALKVHPLFFDNIFEKERKKAENKIRISSGIDKRLSQVNFTKMIAQNKFKLEVNLFKLNKKNANRKRKKR